MNIFIAVLSVIAITYLLVRFAMLIRVPTVIALIVSGIILSVFPFDSFVGAEGIEVIFSLGDLALIALMFLAGMESSFSSLKNNLRNASIIAIFAFLAPFLIGFSVFRLMGFSLLISFVVGICMSITAEATKARVLIDLKKMKTKLGAILMDAGIIDDAFGMAIFVLVTFFLKDVFIKDDLLLAGAILAFFIGVVAQKSLDTIKFIRPLKQMLMLFVVPFFFVSMGLNFDFASLAIQPLIMIVIVTIAIVGKILGTFMAKPFMDLNNKQLFLVGWGMNSRGAVELALALIAFRGGLIPVEIYSSLVVMALVTDLIFPFVVTRMVNKDPKIMD